MFSSHSRSGVLVSLGLESEALTCFGFLGAWGPKLECVWSMSWRDVVRPVGNGGMDPYDSLLRSPRVVPITYPGELKVIRWLYIFGLYKDYSTPKRCIYLGYIGIIVPLTGVYFWVI